MLRPLERGARDRYYGHQFDPGELSGDEAEEYRAGWDDEQDEKDYD